MHSVSAADWCCMYTLYILLAQCSLPTDLLMQFYGLDIDGDRALDYYEFTIYAGVTESAERIFEVMDRDQDNTVTYQEVLDSIQMLEQRTTEGIEDIPDENDGKSTITKGMFLVLKLILPYRL